MPSNNPRGTPTPGRYFPSFIARSTRTDTICCRNPWERALRAAQRAIDLAPSNHYGYHALASVMFLRGERQTFKSVAERAIILNPMDGFTSPTWASIRLFRRLGSRLCSAEKARSLNPHHPGVVLVSSPV